MAIWLVMESEYPEEGCMEFEADSEEEAKEKYREATGTADDEDEAELSAYLATAADMASRAAHGFMHDGDSIDEFIAGVEIAKRILAEERSK